MTNFAIGPAAVDGYLWLQRKEAFEDAQILAEIAYRKMDEVFWFAAMQSLKIAYGVK